MLKAYARVSTLGQSLKDQIKQLKDAGVENKNIYHEKFTGTTTERPKFDKMLKDIQPNDTLVITKLDRLARNTREALNAIESLQNRKVKIDVLNMGMLDNSYTGKFLTTALLGVAQMERDMIVERTQEGKRYAKKYKPDFKDGRPQRSVKSKIRGISYETIHKYFKNHSATETSHDLNISRASVFNVEKTFKEYNKEHYDK